MCNDPIDFTQWTDQQLEVGQRFTRSHYYPELLAELKRREAVKQAEAMARVTGSRSATVTLEYRHPVTGETVSVKGEWVR